MFHRRLFMLAVLVAMLSCAAAHANWIGNVRVEEPPHAYLPNSVKMWVNFDYKITNPAGARFRVTPMYDGAEVPGFTWSGSVVYPVGSGSASNWFAFWSGTHFVGHYLLEMVTPDWNTVLLSIQVPVNFTVGDQCIAHITPSHTSPSWLMRGQQYTVDFVYATTEAGGVQIFARPFHDGALEPGYTASGSDLLASPGGSATQWFRFDAGDHHVDQVRFQMWNAGQTVLLLEVFVPVDLTWGAHGLSNFTLTPGTPECLANGENVTVTFDYATSAVGGVRCWAYAADWPGHAAVSQTYSGSPLLTDAAGHLTRSFTFATSGDVRDIPWVLIRLADASYADLLSVNLPVDYHWGPDAIRNIVYTPASPAVLDDLEHVDVTFDYVTTEAGGVRIFLMPLSDGAGCPNGVNGGSGIYPVGSGSGTGFFSITSGVELVDQVRHWMTNADQSVNLLQFERDGLFFFGGPAFVTAAPEPAGLPAAAAALGAAYPNPFNPVVTIPVTLAGPTSVRVRVFDVRGRLVRTLADGVLPGGRTELTLRADDLPSGAYFCALDWRGARQTQRIMLVR